MKFLINNFQLISLSDKNSQKDEVISTLKKQIIFLQPYQKKFESAEKEIDSLKTQLSTYRKYEMLKTNNGSESKWTYFRIDVMNNGSTEEADLMLEGILTSSNCVESMRVFMINLKK